MESQSRHVRPTPPAYRRLSLPDLDRQEALDPRPLHTARRQTPRFGTDPDRARRAIARAGTVSVDLETRGLHPHASADADIGAVILKAGKQRFILRELPPWWPDVLADAETQKILHNAKFDLMWMIDCCPD